MRTLTEEYFNRVVKSLAQAITIAEVGKLTVKRYVDIKWQSLNGLLAQTNHNWKIIPLEWYRLPIGEYPNLYPEWESRFMNFIRKTLLTNQMSPLDFTAFWGLPSLPREKRLAEYVSRYGSREIERRKGLFIRQGMANGLMEPSREWITKYTTIGAPLI